jgi:predicted nucleic-acid-binding Zn-ribbon protein
MSFKNKNKKAERDAFSKLRDSFLDIDPVHFVKNNLTLDGSEFSIKGNGWGFMAGIYRHIALEATQKSGKPIVIKKGRQVGATMMAGALDLYFTNSGLFSKPPVRVLHAFPALALVKRFSQDKLEGLIRSSRGDFINNNKLDTLNAVDNMTMKQYKTGTLWIDSVGTDGDRVRGMTIDVAFFDEVQDMLGQAIGNATKTLTAAKYGPTGQGVQVYFGTPKERGTYFERIWNMSDQRFYHLGCVNCGDDYPFYTPSGEEWKDIWVSGYIVKCPKCGTEQKKADAVELGKWVSYSDIEDPKFVGFHVNQLYIPYFSKENILNLMPENNPAQSERVWMNEVVGEFYSGTGITLTKGDIYDKCRDPDRSFSKRISPREKTTYLGVDWGGKVDDDNVNRGQSYSCVVIISADKDGILYIEHAHKLRKHDFKYKIDTMNEMYKRFGVKRAVSDWFFGQDVVHDLQQVYRDRFLGAQGSGSLIKPVKYREDELIITYNKNLMLEELFDLFWKGKVRFPWKSYEYLEWLIEHCTSMDIGVRNRSGQSMKHYKKGSTPNDGLMALMYAYMAYKFDITNGFTVKPGIKKDGGYPRSTLAYAPNLK